MGTFYVSHVAPSFRDTAGSTRKWGEQNKTWRPVVLHPACIIKMISATLSPVSPEILTTWTGLGTSICILESQAQGWRPWGRCMFSYFLWDEHSLPYVARKAVFKNNNNKTCKRYHFFNAVLSSKVSRKPSIEGSFEVLGRLMFSFKTVFLGFWWAQRIISGSAVLLTHNDANFLNLPSLTPLFSLPLPQSLWRKRASVPARCQRD